MNRSSKYPIEEIIRDYESGYSLSELQKKYGISPNNAWAIVNKCGKTRSISEAHLFKNKGWRRLPRIGPRGKKKHSTRIVSIPFQHLKKLGFKQDDDLVAKWKVSDDHLELFVRKKQLQ